jgi:Leucine-rich repeat (LRR) protein
LPVSFSGFRTIESISSFTALKALFLENNAIVEIANLESLVQLRTLHLQCNRITQIRNIGHLKELVSLVLNDNLLTTIDQVSGRMCWNGRTQCSNGSRSTLIWIGQRIHTDTDFLLTDLFLPLSALFRRRASNSQRCRS